MKLFYKPGACSMAAHIILNETGTEFELVKVDTGAGQTEAGDDYTLVNPRGYVPALQLDDSTVVTENAAVLQLLADKFSSYKFAPAAGTIERIRVQEYLSFLSSELHKAFSPFFSGRSFSDEEKAAALAKLSRSIGLFDDMLPEDQKFLVDDAFSVADAYAFVILNWSNFIGVSLDPWAKTKAFVGRIGSRPSVQKALRTEGLVS